MIGMETGEFASLMVLGLHWEAWQLQERLTTIAQQCAKGLIFFWEYKKRMEAGEKAIFHARRR